MYTVLSVAYTGVAHLCQYSSVCKKTVFFSYLCTILSGLYFVPLSHSYWSMIGRIFETCAVVLYCDDFMREKIGYMQGCAHE